jgi:hypothetical protein
MVVTTKDLYSRKDTNLVFSCFILRGDVLCYNRTKFVHFEIAMPWEFVRKSTNYTKVRSMHRLYTTLHKTILGFGDRGSMEKCFFYFFLYTPHTRKIGYDGKQIGSTVFNKTPSMHWYLVWWEKRGVWNLNLSLDHP